MAIVMAVAALDTYLHRRVHESTAPGKHLPAPLSNIRLNFGDMAELANASLAARRQNPPVKDRPWVRVRNVLNDRLLKITFQSASEVADALAMIGISQGWKKIATELFVTDSGPIQEELNRIVRRRNQVVHEGDFKQLYRPHSLRRNQISHDEAETAIVWVELLINAMDKIS